MRKKIFVILLALIMCVPLFAACSGDNGKLPKWSEEEASEVKTKYMDIRLCAPEEVDTLFDRTSVYFLGKYGKYKGVLVTEIPCAPPEMWEYEFGSLIDVLIYSDGKFHDAATTTLISEKQRKKLFEIRDAVIAELCANQNAPEITQ